ncbi:DUF6044 family protein [Bacillus sp. PS06]|uniref:DUF6044 family protein n=1 Tax=Bacillus sp. PS06 TaxID=2764176 RepID=UPI001781FB6C|nr:DUF6044 family protein [Bacillus sp. PS06]MBD8071490.1 hypothetical protein [Bacillus sp. PS06]
MNQIERKLFFSAIIFIFIFVSPYFILGENAHIRVHDNLDSNLAWYKVLKESGQVFGSVKASIPQVINGHLSRNAYGTEFSGIVLLNLLFPPMIAYGLSQLITRFFAFLGMYLLLRKHFIRSENLGWVRVGVSLTFALTPFWPSGMLSTLGMPLALWAFLNIRQGERSAINWITLALIPLYASIVLGFFFFLSAMGFFWLSDVIRGKGWNLRFFFAIVFMTSVFLLVDYRLVYSFLFDHVPNSRDEYFHARLTLFHSLRLTFKNYILGHTHVMTVHGLFILPTTLLALFPVIANKGWREEKTFIVLHIINFVLSAWYAFWFYKGWVPLTERFHFLDTFNFARYHFLRPMIIYLLFALSINILVRAGIIWKRTCMFLIIAQLLVLIGFNEEILYHKKPSFKEFYAEEQFREMADYIGQPQETYRVASIGIHPAIAQFNGFYTLDTYNNFYPLTYKYQFRRIIEHELEGNKKLKQYFDEWGGRCYLFIDEIGKHYMFKKNSKKTIEQIKLNTHAFHEMGGRYIFSALPIKNEKDNHLTLEKTFDSRESAWKIYLYRVDL